MIPTPTSTMYRQPSDVDFTLSDCPPLPRAGRVLLTTPAHFDVQYVINPHMEGNVGCVDPRVAHEQWRALEAAYESLGFTVNVLEGAADLCDMVFCANQTLPYYRPDGTRGVVLSRMHAPQRRDEVAHYERFFQQLGFEITAMPPDLAEDFEGMGDAIWHPGRYLLWGGHGIRTSEAAYRFVAEKLGVRVLLVRLDDPDFYHLDTCFSVLDERSVLIYPGAFRAEGLALVEHFFERIVEAPEVEARERFACNAHCPDGEHVLIQRGSPVTNERLEAAGFVPIEFDTDEFIKAGGSVFCMKQMFWG